MAGGAGFRFLRRKERGNIRVDWCVWIFYLWENFNEMTAIPFLIKSGIVTPELEIPDEMLDYLEIDFGPGYDMTDENFFQFCVDKHPLQIEKNKHGKIIIIAPVGFLGGQNEGEAFGELRNWRNQLKQGWTSNPSVAYRLPDGGTHAPDAAWISDEKISKLTKEELKKFPPTVPDFVIDIRSESDALNKLKTKMEDVWMANGVRLAWLIDPKEQKAYIYRQGKGVEVVEDFKSTLSGEEVCPGFEFDLGLMVS